MKKTSVAVALSLVAVLGVGSTFAASTTAEKAESKESKKTEQGEHKKAASDDQAAMQKEAKITMDKAREIALAKVPGGKVESGELEREHGKLIYSFDIRNTKGSVTEVNVDAITSKIVAVQQENA
ncbi:MAG: PepSY domain-containing protein, partial [Acidobacteriota bacterium]